MIIKIMKISENEIVVSFDNRSDLTVTSDNGSAEHIVEHLLSPKFNMTYTEYCEVIENEDEITQIVEIAS